MRFLQTKLRELIITEVGLTIWQAHGEADQLPPQCTSENYIPRRVVSKTLTDEMNRYLNSENEILRFTSLRLG
jgi:hypothetical protein